jgi:hypothetical protein
VSLLVAVVAVGLLGGPAAAAASGGGRVRPDLAGAFVGQINAVRVSHARPRLVVDSALASVAGGWALSMSKSSVLSHNPRLATSVRGWRFLGENVGVGYSLASLEQAFWASVEDFSRPAATTRSRPPGSGVPASGQPRAVHRLDVLAAECASQTSRLFRARHWCRQAMARDRLRASRHLT